MNHFLSECVLKYRANSTREVVIALCAVKSSVLGHLAMMFAAVRTNNSSITPSAFNDRIYADSIIIEIVCHFKETVELREIYHSIYLHYIYKYTTNFSNGKTFGRVFSADVCFFVTTSISLPKYK